MRQILIALLLGTLTLPAAAQSLQHEVTHDDIQLRYGIDRQQVKVGEPLTFTLTVTVPFNRLVQFEAVDDTLGSLSVAERHPSGPKKLTEERTIWQRQYLLMPNAAGNAEIPSLHIDVFTERPEYLNRRCVGARDCLDLLERRVPPDVRLASSKRSYSTQPLAVKILAVESELPAPLNQHKYLDGEIKLQLDIDRRQITTAQSLRYTLSVITPQRVIPEFEPVGDTLGELKVVSRHPKGPNEISDQQHRWQREYILRSEEAGEFTLPALKIEFYTLDKPIEREPCLTAADCPRLSAHDPGPSVMFAHTRRELSTEPVTISVSAAPVETDSVIGLLKEKALSQHWWVLGVLLLLAAGVAAILIRAQKRAIKTISKSESSAKTASPLAQEILAQLRDLSNSSDDLKDRYRHIDRTVRIYLAQRLEFNALARSSEEIISQVVESPLAGQLDALNTILQRCDRVKFAAHKPEVVETDDTLLLAERFVLAAGG